jgi:hypothetical protein
MDWKEMDKFAYIPLYLSSLPSPIFISLPHHTQTFLRSHPSSLTGLRIWWAALIQSQRWPIPAIGHRAHGYGLRGMVGAKSGEGKWREELVYEGHEESEKMKINFGVFFGLTHSRIHI